MGQLIAQHMGASYMPYKNDDMGYFMGWKGRDACTPEYLRDFGELGTFSDFKKTHKKGKNYELY